MKVLVCICLAAIWANLPIEAAADVTGYLVARDFSAGNKVLELDVPPEEDGDRFFLVFENNFSERGFYFSVARAGRHSYEIRDFPEWRGTIQYLAISLEGVKSRLKDPTFADNIDIFLEPQRISPATVNFLIQHKIFVWSWTTCLLLIFIATALVIRILKKTPAIVALGMAFILTWTLMDLRTVFDHAIIVYKEETLHKGLPPLVDTKLFADQAADIIRGAAWTSEPIEFGGDFLNYRLAQYPYAPSGAARTPSFWLTNDPAGRRVVLRREKYYLVEKQEP